jgi:GT2 family glycosyltransferase
MSHLAKQTHPFTRHASESVCLHNENSSTNFFFLIFRVHHYYLLNRRKYGKRLLTPQVFCKIKQLYIHTTCLLAIVCSKNIHNRNFTVLMIYLYEMGPVYEVRHNFNQCGHWVSFSDMLSKNY